MKLYQKIRRFLIVVALVLFIIEISYFIKLSIRYGFPDEITFLSIYWNTSYDTAIGGTYLFLVVVLLIISLDFFYKRRKQ
jgi:hypothetical protein